MPAKKATAPEPKPAPIYLKGKIIDTKAAQASGPTFWLFQSPSAGPFIGVGSAAEAQNYARSLNQHRIDHMTVRPLSVAEAEALSASVLAAAVNGDNPPTFNIAREMARLNG